MKKTNFDISDTQKAFDKNVGEKLITKKRSPKKKKQESWVRQCWDIHLPHLGEDDVAVVEWNWDEEKDRCWCCGVDSNLQKCHIIPKSLGGSKEYDNIVPLCVKCHDNAPDVQDKKQMFRWIKKQQNWLTRMGMGHLTNIEEIIFDYCKQVSETTEISDDVIEEIKKIMEETSKKITFHYGQMGQGAFMKDSTREWWVDKTFETFFLNKEIEDWEEKPEIDKKKLYKS